MHETMDAVKPDKADSKKILVVSLFFAPSAQVGAKRFSFLSRILQEKNCELHVLTLKEKYLESRDDTLECGGILHRVSMYPTNPVSTNNIFKKVLSRLWTRYLCLVDPYSGSIIPAFIKGLGIVKHHEIELIIATGPKFSAFVIGYLLSLCAHAKLVLDYRDPWAGHQTHYAKIFGKKISRFFERRAIAHASAIVFCSDIMKESFIRRYGLLTQATCHVITNGYLDRNYISPLSLGTSRKNMVYAGNLYGERRLKLLARSLRQLLDEKAITKDNFCFHVFGKLSADDVDVIKAYRLQGVIEEHAPVPYQQMIGYLKGADILFLPSGSDVRYAIPFKLYDYLSVKRPILAVAPADSAVAQLMHDIDCGRLALINSENSILNSLRKMLLEDQRYTYCGAQDYTWEKIGKKYLQVINEVTASAYHKGLAKTPLSGSYYSLD